jgi:hypothetical protein
LTALRALGGPTNCPGFRRLAIAQGHASTLNHAVAASAWSAAQTAENASLYIRDLGNEQAERFGRGLTYLFNDWIERFGPVKDCEVHVRQKTIKKMRSDARRRYERDMGAAYALEVLSYHIEAPYLPGEDAAFVYDLTPDYISQAGDAARRMAREPRQESESGSSGF